MFGLGITHYGLQELANGNTEVTVVRRIPKIMDLPERATLEITESYDRLHAWFNRDGSVLAQDFFPELSGELREFLISGITPTEWNKMFGKEECG